ncbi:MAG TPA: endolytic transglycosylase MltG [Pseudolabrys sp.]|nr:endolytic transglycosylase MltG [Pseudolabrys sp.]
MNEETPQGDNGKPPLPRESRPLAPRSPRAALEPERVPQPSRRSLRVRHPAVIAGNAFFTLLVLLAIAAGTALYFGKQRYDAPGPLKQDKVVNIPRGLGSRQIAELLEHQGVISEPWVFIGGVTLRKARGELKHGEYRFPAHASIAKVVDTMIEGKVVQHTVTVPEGLTSEQIVARLLGDDALSGPIAQIPREGTLLPDTYNFTRGMTRERMIKRMQRDEKRVLAEIWAHRAPDLPLKTPQDLVTLASIVEKETGKPDERSRVAAVFINRLKRNMRLQSDPTIIYGLTGGKGSLGHPLLKSEMERPNPYNTYQIDGLPPGPISNPGRASLEATANPARTKDLYFVADGTGGHVFSESYQQHLKNVAHLRGLQKEDRQEEKAQGAAQDSAKEGTKDGAKGSAAKDTVQVPDPEPAPAEAKAKPRTRARAKVH